MGVFWVKERHAMTKDEIILRLGDDQVLSLFYAAGCKEPNKLKINSKGFTTIRCCKHEDSECPRQGKRASLNVNVQSGWFECKSCGFKGGIIDIAQMLIGHNASYRESLQYLADIAGVTLGESTYTKPKPLPKAPPKPIEYVIYDNDRRFVEVNIEAFMPKFTQMTEAQQYKMVLTSIYRASLLTDQTPKQKFYKNRGIHNSTHNISMIGFIPKNDSSFWKPIEQMFGLEVLIKFGFYQPADAQWHPMAWKFGGGDVCFIPSFDLYTDLLSGAMLRPLIKPKKGQKEFSLNQPKLVFPIPFKLTKEILMSDKPIWITEGSVDGLSLGDEVDFASIPGVNGLPDELLGLFQGKKVILAFDQDRAGQQAALGYTDDMDKFHDGLKQRLEKAGAAFVSVARWNIELGKDLNDLLQNGHLHTIEF
jgi:DNA primase